MKGNLRLMRFLSLVVAISLILLGCRIFQVNESGETQIESQSVEAGSATSVKVSIEMDHGELKIGSGNGKLMEGTFQYNVAEWKPQVSYSVNGSQGSLLVSQPDVELAGLVKDGENVWDVQLNEDMPMDLSVNVGAGVSDLQLADLSLTGLEVSLGLGESTIDLSGDRERDLEVAISGGAGDINVRLPEKVGARVEIESGVGTVNASGLTKEGNAYTNAAYGSTDATLLVTIQAGIGKITLDVAESAAAKPNYSAVTGELSRQIQAAIEEAGITGLSVALVDDQEIVWSEGFGYADKQNGIEAAPETVYTVASVSKLFTAAAILQLADQGKIDIDQPLQTYVPGFSMQSRFPDAGPITPRNLMTHHAGVPSNMTNGMVAYGDDQDALTRSEYHNLIDELKQVHVISPPDTVFSYSNVGYSLLGHAVEGASGQDFIDYMDTALLGPLGMDSSSFTLRPEMKPRLSKEYLDGEEQPVYWSRDISAASLRSTVEDLSRFMMMVFGGGELGGQRILRPETLAEMLSPQSGAALDLGAQWGLGWWMIPLPGLEYAGTNAWHAGGEGMWNSLMVVLPDHKLGVVLLNNSQENAGGANFQIAIAVLRQALKLKAGIESAAEPPQVIALPAAEQQSYAGLYTTDIGWMNIRQDGADLYADALGGSFKLLPHGGGRFSLEGVSPSDAQMVFGEVNGRTAVYLYGLFVDVSYGERVEPGSIPQAWMDRVGSYEVTNAKPGFLTFIADVQLKVDNDFLMLSLTRTDTREQIEFPIGPVSDAEAVVLGLGQRNRGDAVSVVEVDGEEQLFYSGYLMKKVEGAAEQPAPQGAVYQDPVGRFSLPLVGDWAQLETDGSFGLFEVPGVDFKMYALSVESTDLAAGEDAALIQVGIDPSALTKTDDAELGDWTINFYTLGGGQGVTPVCQIADQLTYCLIAAGDESLTNNPPEHVMMTIQGFTIAGKEAALPSTVEEFEAYVNTLVGDNPPGLAIVISQGGNLLYSKAFGTADGPGGMAAEPDTVFPWGSMTKMATGTAVMQLVDQGLVDLDAPVSDYLDYFPAEYGITVRQLLDHSSGLREPVDFLLPSLSLDGQPLADPDQVARAYLEGITGPIFEPGSASAYGNPNFVLLGQIVAEVSGQPFVEYVKEHILVPLGMQNTDFTYSNQAMIAKAAAPAFPAELVEDFIAMMDRARGLGDGAEFIREVDDNFAWMNHFSVLSANGGLIGPATEVLRFTQMHLNGGELDGVRILSQEAVAQMQVMQKSTAGVPLGYGAAWRIFDEAEHPFVEHDGGGWGLWAKMRLYPKEGLAIVLMSNESGWNRDKVADAAANVVFTMVGQ